MPHFIIKGLGRGFDGLVVEGYLRDVNEDRLVVVEKITNRNEIFGDRNVSFPVEDGALFIHSDYVQEIEDPVTREFDSKNPWGDIQYEGRYTKGPLDVAYAQYDRRLQVTVTEKAHGRSRTLWAGYFENHLAAQARREIEACLGNPDDDAEDLVFMLRSLNGEG